MHLREGELRDAIPSKISFQKKEGDFESGRNFKNAFNESILSMRPNKGFKGVNVYSSSDRIFYFVYIDSRNDTILYCLSIYQ